MAVIRKGGTASGSLVFGPFVPISITHFDPMPPIPPQPPPAGKATIISYQTPILVSQTSRAVAKLTQGDPLKCWFQWQYFDGVWVNANTHRNPATDIDHHYAFPHVGSFPIRLQTWDAATGGHLTDQSSSTSRTVVVRATTPTPIPPEPPEPTPIPPANFRGRLTIAGTTFRDKDGAIWKWHGVTAFTALQDWLAGNTAKLEAYATWTRQLGASVWRVFGMWTVTNFEPLGQGYYAGLSQLADWLRQRGMYLQFVVFCDQVQGSRVLMTKPQRDQHVTDCTIALAGHDNVLIELENEPWKNGDNARDYGQLATLLSTRGAFQDGKSYTQAGSLLQWTTEHTPRDSAFPQSGIECKSWTRKGKNLLETARLGLGAIASPSGVPAISGEPIGIFEESQPGRRTNDPKAIADYFATVELYGAGGNLHGDMANLMTCTPPGPQAQACANAVRDVWTAGIAPDVASTGQYTRGGFDSFPMVHHDRYNDAGQEIDPSGALRSFGMIQGRQATCVIVQAGKDWTPKGVNGWTITHLGGPQRQIVWLTR